MSDHPSASPYPGYPEPLPPARQLPPPRPRGSGLGCLFALSVMFNLILLVALGVMFLVALIAGGARRDLDQPLIEKHHSGEAGAGSKVAIVQIEGVILEGAIEFAKKQIEQAAADDDVKAVVLRIDSPGGSITASDELHRRIAGLIKGKGTRAGKPAVVSMGSLAASGGYYVAMPCSTLYAERTTLTGSIGVFASFPNIKELGEKIGFKMITVKAGDVKDAGSPFKDMTDQEKQLWQDMVDNAYEQFLNIVRDGRPKIKDELKEVVLHKMITVKGADGKLREEPFVRTRVDGGIFTADQAKEFGLVDKIGYLEDAIKDVAAQAGLGSSYEAMIYEKPLTLANLLFGTQAKQSTGPLDPQGLAAAATPRLWYLAPQSELAGLLTAAGR